MTNKDGFLNVYNFIPFPEKKSKRYEDEDRHTGVIEYTITTKTPLFIPNTSNQDAYSSDIDKKERCYDFFSYEELNGKTDYSKAYSPVIPGSELRGMTRNLYEMLTDSCMAVLNGQERPVKRTAENFKAGLIKKDESGNYTLIDAEDCIYREGNNKRGETYKTAPFHEGQKVYFEKKERTNKNGRPVSSLITECTTSRDREHSDCGYIIKGTAGPEGGTKRNAHVFMPRKKMIRDLTNKDFEYLNSVIKDYMEKTDEGKKYIKYKEALDAFKKNEGPTYFPVYYSQVPSVNAKYLYLSPAKITKEISHSTIEKLAGDMNPCKMKEDRCPACDLFGMVGKNNEEAMGTRIRFTDAFPVEQKENKEYYMEPVILQELSSPKLGNVEFYLEPPQGADFWTYDYFVKGNEEIAKEGKLRGRKFYWNQPDMTFPKEVDPTERNYKARPVKRGITFAGKLYYDGISQKQLDQLLWILNGGTKSGEENDIVYKIGGGKPLGLGSVEFQVAQINERTLKDSNGQLVYDIETQKAPIAVINYEANGFNRKSKKAIFNMLAYEKLKGFNISYPMTIQQKAEENKGKGLENGYTWFTANHLFYNAKTGKYSNTGMMQKRTTQRFDTPLPLAEELKTMPYLNDPTASSYSNDRPQNSKPNQFKSNKTKLVEGQTYCGEVTGFMPDGKKLIFRAKDGGDIRLHRSVFYRKLGQIDLKKTFPVGTKIEIKYQGIDQKGYPQYQYIGIAKEN